MKHRCEKCGFETDNGKVFSNHIRWQHKTDKESEKYKSYQKKLADTQRLRKVWEDSEVEIPCKECGKLFKTIKQKNKNTGEERFLRNYCSDSCSHKQGSKSVDYSKVSEWAKNHKVGFLSIEYLMTHDGVSSQKNMSKRELEIVNYFKTNFPNDEWKQGLILGGKKFEGVLLNPDLWSKKLKVIIEYDGIWHFENIHNQLEEKQRKDRILKKFCEENNYRLIRIDEDLNLSFLCFSSN